MSRLLEDLVNAALKIGGPPAMYTQVSYQRMPLTLDVNTPQLRPGMFLPVQPVKCDYCGGRGKADTAGRCIGCGAPR